MEIKYLITFASFILTFSAGFFWLSAYSKHISDFESSSATAKDSFLPLFVILFVSFSALFFTNKQFFDFIYHPQYWSLLAAFLAAGLIYLGSLFKKSEKYTPLIILTAAIGCSFLLPKDFLLFEGNLPLILDRTCIILLWFLFSFSYKYMNGIDGILSLQTATSGAGIFFISLLGGAPLLLGNYALALVGTALAFMAFSWYPARIVLKQGAAPALGFIVAWLIIQSSVEKAASCNLIFNLFLISEVIWAAALKLTRRPQYKNIMSNTHYYQANVSGLAPNLICNATAKLQALLLILGTFQVYAPNAYSLPAISFVLTLWFSNKIKNWQEETVSLKEINTNFIRDIKENVSDIKQHLNQDK